MSPAASEPLLQELSERIAGRFAWFRTDSTGRAVSDHNGIHIDIAV